MTLGELGLTSECLADFCRRWKIAEMAVFGSAVRGELRPDSDIDLLVRFSPDARWTLLDHIRMEEELSRIVGREVEIATRQAVEESRNWIRREHILETAQSIYESYGSGGTPGDNQEAFACVASR